MENSQLCSRESQKLAQLFINLWSYTISMNARTYEKECLELVDLLDYYRSKWKELDVERKSYQQKCHQLQEQLKESESVNLTIRDQLVNWESEVNSLLLRIEAFEKELGECNTKFDAIREKLRSPMYTDDEEVHLDDNTADFSVTSHSDIDYDRIGESVNGVIRAGSNQKRRSQSMFPGNNNRNAHNILGITTREIKHTRDEVENISSTFPNYANSNKNLKSFGRVTLLREPSMSEGSLNKTGLHQGKAKAPLLLSRTHQSMTVSSSWTDGVPIEKRRHRPESFKSRWERCDICNRKLGWNNSNVCRCQSCLIRCHRNCFELLPMPCIPHLEIPRPKRHQKLPLKSYCLQSHPMIPPLLIRCVLTIEKDRFNKEGLYRVPGANSSVNKLYESFMTSKVLPDLNGVDTDTITGVIKKFLRELKDTLIPTTSYNEFKVAVDSDINPDGMLKKAVYELPNANRDTLAFLLQHLQTISKYSSHNKMTLDNLCRVLAPTIVGYSTFITTMRVNQDLIAKGQFSILYRLLKIPHEFWRQFIETNMSAVIYQESMIKH